MNITGANNFSETNDYTIYTMNSNQSGQYSFLMPKNTDGQISMLVDMNMKADFDALVANTITKESLLEKIEKEYSKIKETNPQGILVFPMTDVSVLGNAVNTNDKQKIIDETKKIGGITSELYKTLTESGLDKSKINQKIIIVEKNETDNKFVDWLKVQMPNFVEGIKVSMEEAPKQEEANPFAGFNPFGEPEPAPAAEAPTPEVAPAPIFDTPAPEPAPVAEPTPVPEPTPEVAPEPALENTQIVEPQPVNSVSLENTQAIAPAPVAEAPAPVAEVPAPEPEKGGIARKSGGFANILIILIILAVVTVASIELGKFLFNTFGT